MVRSFWLDPVRISKSTMQVPVPSRTSSPPAGKTSLAGEAGVQTPVLSSSMRFLKSEPLGPKGVRSAVTRWAPVPRARRVAPASV